MTDSKTQEWAAKSDGILGDYLDLSEPRHQQLSNLISQALAAVDHRAYARGIEDAAKVGFQVSQHVHAKADDVSKAIRQLLEVKG